MAGMRGRRTTARAVRLWRRHDGDEVVGDDAEADPTLDAGIAVVLASIESMPVLDHGDTSFGCGARFLPVEKPTFLLLAFCARRFWWIDWEA
jgi:hypothetical protein